VAPAQSRATSEAVIAATQVAALRHRAAQARTLSARRLCRI